jgi:hypothetical protein
MKEKTPCNRHRRLFQGAAEFKKIAAGHNLLQAEFEVKHRQGAPCILAKSYRALIRVVGHFKYNNTHPILLRGQTQCFGAMRASLHRRSPVPADQDVEQFLQSYRTTLNIDNDPVDALSTEPLLQHYGIETRWIDVVDSVPHALFFATHRLVESPVIPCKKTFVPSTDQFGIIYLLDIGSTKLVQHEQRDVAGLSIGSSGVLVADLRKLKPSLALRPHAQHGLLLRASEGSVDLWSRVVARIAVPTADARRWINSRAFEPAEMFPPKVWDGVYGKLLSPKMKSFLDAERKIGHEWGGITQYDFHAV